MVPLTLSVQRSKFAMYYSALMKGDLKSSLKQEQK